MQQSQSPTSSSKQPVIKKKSSRFFFVLFFVVSIIFLISVSRFFTVSTFKIHGTTSLFGLASEKGKLIFFVSEYEVSDKLLKKNPIFKSVMVSKQYPNTLSITVEKDEPVARLKVNDGFYLLTREGKITAKFRNTDELSSAPTIFYYQTFQHNAFFIGEKLSQEDLLAGLYFIDQFSSLGVDVDRLDIAGTDMLVLMSTDGKVYNLTTLKDQKQQVEEFKIIYKRFTIEQKDYKSIDLRFDKPIITLQ